MIKVIAIRQQSKIITFWMMSSLEEEGWNKPAMHCLKGDGIQIRAFSIPD